MIKIDRDSVQKPSFFHSKEYERLQQEITDFYKLRKNTRAQRSYTVEYFPDEVVAAVMELSDRKCAYCESYLMGLKVGDESYVSRFRPDSYAQGFNSKEIDADYYWWLTYEWENLYATCHSCQRFKSNVFPVNGKRVTLQTPYENIQKKENAYLIDPCVDEPSHFFEFNLETHEIIPSIEKPSSFISKIKFDPSIGEMIKQKAEATIQILGLNRRNLIGERKMISDTLKREVEDLKKGSKAARDLASEIVNDWVEILNGNSTKDHIAYRIAVIKKYLEDKEILAIVANYRKDIGSFGQQQQQQQQQQQMQMPPDFISQEEIKGSDNLFEAMEFPLEETPRGLKRDKKKPPKVDKAVFSKKDDQYFTKLLKNVYLYKIELHNFKCFSDLTLELPDYADDTTAEPWLVFLGENGVGKSSVLKAIAIALMGQEYLDTLGIEVSDVLKYGKQKGYIRVYGKGNDQVYEVTLNKKQNTLVSNIEKPPAFIIGYGSTRLLPIGKLEPEKDHPNYLKIKNLFDASISLSNATDWFLNTDLKTFNQVSKTLKSLLLLDDLDEIKRNIKKKEILINYHHSGDHINIKHLSDGYKSIFAVAIDMIYTLSQENVVYELAEGIVLIDEIGTHLHPRWKMEIVGRLRKTFPKIQFLITTHEPLCLRGLVDNEVVVLKRDENNAIMAITDLPSPSSLRIDQLLTSEFFGLNSTMDIETEKLFKDYYELLAINESDRSADQKKRLQTLEKRVKDIKYMRFGNDKREEIVYQVVDELMAKDIRKKQLKIETKDMKKEAIDTVKNLWESLD